MTFDEYFCSLKDKRIAVAGLGVSNRPLLEILLDYNCDITVCDKREAASLGGEYEALKRRGVKFSLGNGYLDELRYDVIFRTPGLLPMAFKAAAEGDCAITSEMEAFFALCPCKTIAVTGSDGKTTTATLIAQILKTSGFKVHLGGNIGKPLLPHVREMSAGDVAVLELSSFQLHSMCCTPDVAVVTNISPNHLDVHPDFEDYVESKKNVYLGQSGDGRLILNADNEIAAAFAETAPSRVTFFSMGENRTAKYQYRDGAIFNGGQKIIDESDILLPGKHNIENLMAAFAAVEGLADAGTSAEIARSFGGVEHRIELVKRKNGVSYYNDSIATSPTRASAALRSFSQKVVLIAGGHDKNVPYDELAGDITRSVKALFLTGETAGKIEQAVKQSRGYDAKRLPIAVIDDFTACVRAACAGAGEGDIVILSPACSSYDRFKNFEERGNLFKEIVKEL